MLIIFLFSSVFAFAETPCSPLNYCRIEKKTWQNKGDWKTLATKDLNFDKFCSFDRPQVNLEDDLGIELWLMDGEKDKSEGLTQKPYVRVNLHTYKLTYVIASASVPVDSPAVSFSHRLKPKGKEIIKVECFKK